MAILFVLIFFCVVAFFFFTIGYNCKIILGRKKQFDNANCILCSENDDLRVKLREREKLIIALRYHMNDFKSSVYKAFYQKRREDMKSLRNIKPLPPEVTIKENVLLNLN